MRTSKILSISLPPKMLKQVKTASQKEDKTQSEFLRTALRSYLDWQEFKNLQKKASLRAKILGINNEKDIEKIVDEKRK